MQNDHRWSVFRAEVEHLALARQATEEVHGCAPIDDASLKAFLANPACYLLLVVKEDQVLGSLNGYALRKPYRPQPQFLLYEIDVRPGCRRQGVGRALMDAFTAEARAAGAYELWVVTNQSNVAAMELYRQCGYKRQNDDDVMLGMQL